MDKILQVALKKKASDVFITAGRVPTLKVDGELVGLGEKALTAEQVGVLVQGLMSSEQREEFAAQRECQFAIEHEEVGRFRVSALYQRNQPAMVLRRIETVIPRPEELGLPGVLSELVMAKRGLILFVGATGTGKSTSLASLIGHRNRSSKGHIISIEDPVEYLHQHDQCIVTQREVGIDTQSIEVGLRNTLRQAPDVIYIGEIRTRDAMQHALTFAETGHLCLSTLHANNANQALDRILHFYPPEQHGQVWMDLSLNLKAIVAQQLVPGKEGGRHPCFEILLNTPLVADLIRKGSVDELKELMRRSGEQGMQTFDQALGALCEQGKVAQREALRHADSPNDLRLLLKMHGLDPRLLDAAGEQLQLDEESPALGGLSKEAWPITGGVIMDREGEGNVR